jgi:hypothetical protein
MDMLMQQLLTPEVLIAVLIVLVIVIFTSLIYRRFEISEIELDIPPKVRFQRRIRSHSQDSSESKLQPAVGEIAINAQRNVTSGDVVMRDKIMNVHEAASSTVPFQAEIHLEVVKNIFNHSFGSRPNSWPGVRGNAGGFDREGLPDWGSLWARVRIANVGREYGRLECELDETKTNVPPLFALETDKFNIFFDPPVSIVWGRRMPIEVDFYFDILFNERDPRAFAKALKSLVESKQEYQVVLRYWTIQVDGKTEARPLCIGGNFEALHQRVIQDWNDKGFTDLANLAQLS